MQAAIAEMKNISNAEPELLADFPHVLKCLFVLQ
jgi:hypothetical protein